MTASRAAQNPAVPPYLAGLCDDAALFPPGSAPVVAAVQAHRVHRAAWYADLVGPFLLGPDTIAETGAAAGDTPLDVVLVVRAGPAALAGALADLAAWPALRPVGVELGPDGDGTPAEAAARGAAALDRLLPPGAGGVLEVRRGPGLEAALDAVAATPYRAKYRTGGLTAADFPRPPSWPASSPGARAAAWPSNAPRGCTRRSGTPTRRPASPTTASSTC
ncbi:hypothetical protein VSR01_36115 [Actinacidiphila sp. DG2A-62]|uniref:hypothetical protein n=1 Tax=Actinacidiphila sp. DG2A-62 TaxID=3108821 RepID=UPI002DBCC8F4|nr:hypothetical protein [Actinacidiphila sp. DG2A-62]MEC3998623.1 hypothetical protein [Actinacidiphila sp. DG2A-62]